MATTLNETYAGLPTWEAIEDALYTLPAQKLLISGKLSNGKATVEFTVGLDLVDLRGDFDKYGLGDAQRQDVVAELLAGEMQMIRFANRVDFPNAEVIDLAWTVQ